MRSALRHADAWKISFVRHQVAQLAEVADLAWNVPTSVRIDGKRRSAMPVVDTWLRRRAAPDFLLLGGYGSGKSHFCQVLTARLCNEWLTGRSDVFPILVRVSFGELDTSLADVVLASVNVGRRRAVDFSAFDGPQTVVIMDGLDEALFDGTAPEVEKLFRDVEALPLHYARLFITARASLFLRTDETRGVSKLQGWYSSTARVRGVYIVAQLDDFRLREQNLYMTKRLGTARAEEARRAITKAYGLPQMTVRPLFLRMLSESYGRLPADEQFNIGSIYDAYVRSTLGRRARLRHLAVDDLIVASRRVAVASLARRRKGLSAEEFAKAVNDEHITPRDLMLERDNDRFRFTHESLGEYFLAGGVAQEIRQRRPSDRLLRTAYLSKETVAFLQSSRVPLVDRDLAWLVDHIELGTNPPPRLAINILLLCENFARDLVPRVLLALLRHDNVEVQRAALKSAGYCRNVDVGAAIPPFLSADDADTRYLALESAALHRSPKAVKLIITGINSSNSSLRQLCLWAMRKVRGDKLATFATVLLRTKDPEAMSVAAQVVGMEQSRGALPTLKRLRDAGLPAPARYFVMEAIESIASAATFPARAWPELLPRLLRTPGRQPRLPRWLLRYLIETIGEQRLVAYSSWLKGIYAASGTFVRYTIVDALGEFRDRENTDFLVRAFGSERQARIRGNILWALGNIGDVRGLDAILRGISDTDAVVTTWAQWARAQYLRQQSHIDVSLRYIYPDLLRHVAG